MEIYFTGFGVSIILTAIIILHRFFLPECVSCHILNCFHLTAGDSKQNAAVFLRIPAKEVVTFLLRLR